MTHNTTPSYKKVDQRNRPGDLILLYDKADSSCVKMNVVRQL